MLRTGLKRKLFATPEPRFGRGKRFEKVSSDRVDSIRRDAVSRKRVSHKLVRSRLSLCHRIEDALWGRRKIAIAESFGGHGADQRLSLSHSHPFVADEEKRVLLFGPRKHGAAERAAELILFKRRDRIARPVEVVLSIEGRIAKELIQVSVEISRPGLVNQVDCAASAASKLRIRYGRFDAEFGDCIDGREDQDAESVVVFGIADAIDQVIVFLKACSVYGISGNSTLHRDRATRGLRLRRHYARRELQKLREIAAVQRKIPDCLFGAQVRQSDRLCL